MRPDPVAYQDLIASLADGTPVDWAGLEAGADNDQERRRYHNLRLVARVAELHRTITLDHGADETAAIAADAPDAPGTWGHLHLLERLASGSFGDLYRARDPQLDRDVALKLLRPRATPDGDTAQVLAEARTLARVSHRNVVIVHGADVRDGRAGLWMELIDGETLAASLIDRGRFGAGETVGIGRDLCRALSAVHGAGLVHSDVKTQNVMREAGGRIVLMDFGSGRRQGASAAVAGTPLYLAPEVLAGAPPTPASDIYSLGVLLFHLLTLGYPYSGADFDALRRAHADGTRLHLRDLRPDLPDAVVDSVERALATDPARRFQTAGAMERALAKAQETASSNWTAGIAAVLVAAAAITVAAAAMRPIAVDRSIRSLAVRPFVSADEGTAHLVAGLSTDVLRELQRLDIQVVTAGPPVASTPSGVDGRVVADATLAGDARREGTGTALKLAIRRAGGTLPWDRTYQIADSELPMISSAIARDVAAEIGAAFRTGAAPRAARQINQRAYDAYQRGRTYSERRNQADLMVSLQHFAEASRLDPAYAEPWAGLADAYLALGVPPFGDLRPMEARKRAREAAEKALALNPDLAEAETSLAWGAALYDWDWPVADARFKRAIQLNPQYPLARHWYAMFLTDMGLFDEARAEIKEAQVLQPSSALIQRDVAWVDFLAGQYGNAIVQLRDMMVVNSRFAPAITLLARSLAANGQTPEALIELERARPDISLGSYLSFRGYIEAASGDPRARQTLAELTEFSRREYVTPYYFALIHTALGQRDDAIAALERAYSEQDATLGSVYVDPRFESLRTDPRFQAIVKAMRFPIPRR